MQIICDNLNLDFVIFSQQHMLWVLRRILYAEKIYRKSPNNMISSNNNRANLLNIHIHIHKLPKRRKYKVLQSTVFLEIITPKVFFSINENCNEIHMIAALTIKKLEINNARRPLTKIF